MCLLAFLTVAVYASWEKNNNHKESLRCQNQKNPASDLGLQIPKDPVLRTPNGPDRQIPNGLDHQTLNDPDHLIPNDRGHLRA